MSQTGQHRPKLEKEKKIDGSAPHNHNNRQGRVGPTMGHDTLKSGQVAGRLHATNRQLTQFMANIKGETKGTLEDGHCLRRALGKLWGIRPGQVVSKLCEGGEHITKHGGKLKIECATMHGMKTSNIDGPLA
jgi:hypothetical protein